MRPGGSVGLPCAGVPLGVTGVTVGVVLVLGLVLVLVVGVALVPAVGVAVGAEDVDPLDGRSPGEGVVDSSVTGRRVVSEVLTGSPGSGVSAGCWVVLTLGAGCCLPASGSGINGVSTCGPPSTLLASSTRYPTAGMATTSPSRRILR